MDKSQKYVWLQNLCWIYRKATLLWETWRKHFLMVLRHGRTCEEMRGKILRTGEQNNSTTIQMTTTNSRKKKFESVGELSKVCSQIVLKCLYLACIGRPDVLWSVNKLVRAITKWTRASDKRLARLISFYLHHTSEYRQYCYVGNTAHQCRLGLFQDSDFAGDLGDPKSISSGLLCIFGSHTFVPTSWMCKKQTSVSHSSTESEILSLDASSRVDGIPALTLWGLVV